MTQRVRKSMPCGAISASRSRADASMMLSTILAIAVQDADVPASYDVSRLYTTLAFMYVVVLGAVAFVRIRFPRRLIAEIALTLGIFLLVIGTIVYTVAFRGLQPVELVIGWVLSFAVIAWFVIRL